jgi:hypothetical protein
MTPEERELESIRRRAFWGTVIPLLAGGVTAGLSKGRVVPDVSVNRDYLAGLQSEAEALPEKRYRRQLGELDLSQPDQLERARGLAMKQLSPAELLTYMARQRSGGGMQAWQARGQQWADIEAMPDGPEKDAAITNFYMSWSPSIGYESTPLAQENRRRLSAAGAAGSVYGRVGAEAATAETAGQTAGTIEKGKQEGAQGGPLTQTDAATKLRNEYDAKSAEFKLIDKQRRALLAAWNGAEQARKAGKPAGTFDKAMLAAAINIIAPNARVNESNLASFGSTGGVFDEVQNWIKKVLVGQQLGPEEREQIRDLAEGRWNESAAAQEKRAEFYRNEALRQNIDPTRIVPSEDVWEIHPDVTQDEYQKLPKGATYWYGNKQYTKE